MQNIFSTGIQVHQLEGIDNEKLIQYAEKYSLRNQLKEKYDILNNSIFSTVNNLVEINYPKVLLHNNSFYYYQVFLGHILSSRLLLV